MSQASVPTEIGDCRMTSFADTVPCYEWVVSFGPNDTPFFQDMSSCRSIPHGIEFHMTQVGGDVKLTGADHGGRPYGNGAIYVRIQDLPQTTKVAPQ